MKHYKQVDSNFGKKNRLREGGRGGREKISEGKEERMVWKEDKPKIKWKKWGIRSINKMHERKMKSLYAKTLQSALCTVRIMGDFYLLALGGQGV